jgi:hypothetical protein
MYFVGILFTILLIYIYIYIYMCVCVCVCVCECCAFVGLDNKDFVNDIVESVLMY